MNGRRTIFRVLLHKQPQLFLCFSTLPSFDSLLFHPYYDLTICISFLQTCAHHGNLSKGKEIHSYVLKNGFLNSLLSVTSLINMYSKCSLMNYAVKVFNYLAQEDKNVYAYNAIISGVFANGFSHNAFELYKQMRCVGIVPDKFTFPCVIRSCSNAMDAFEVKKIHGLLFKLGLELDIFVGSALVNTYLRFGLTEEAQEMFDELTVRDVVLWNSMVNGYAQIARFDEALEVFRLMGLNGVIPNRYTVTGVLSIFAMTGDLDYGRAVHGFVIKMGYDSVVSVANALIDMYGKCGCLIDALNIFEAMNEKDIFSWNSMLSVHEHCTDHYGTLRIFNMMLGELVKPDLVTITNVLPACAHLAALVHGREIHGYMIVNGFGKDNSLVNNAVMDMYAKCGDMIYARLVFDNIREKDLASWNIMIMGYGMHGCGDEALEFFSQLCQTQLAPDEITFVGLLSACSHAGMVKKGQEFLAEMESKYGVSPTIEHYTCVIDMLGRAGQLQEAYNLVLTMPIEANPIGWRALLAACHLHKHKDLAKIAARKLIELEPGHSGNYVLMSNVYVVAGQYEEVSEVIGATPKLTYL
ncbi:pentatricopeptide repeat-containing protein At3g14730 isoform X2 [Prosopis cineraria]|uniref:pentatricopeptide repeat-containing protein At3g14730 isoform X2 n=1 Tax=Prosopis cineraria TaxID=364024 RepID=UPI00240F60C0|nr:pentatricopeptide repeat-containing protein At3g14730 isoform X2 [Prosopis cineraria]